MPIEANICGPAQEQNLPKLVNPGGIRTVAKDFVDGEQYNIIVYCAPNDIGGDVYRIKQSDISEHKGGITPELFREGHLGSIATNGIFRTLSLKSESGEISLLSIEHRTSKFILDDHIGRYVQI